MFLGRCRWNRKRRLLEVFAVLFFEEEETLDLEQILQDDLVLYSAHKYMLYEFSSKRRVQVNSEGGLILSGPRHGIEIRDHFTMSPYYVYREYKLREVMWERRSDMSDCLISKWLETKTGFMKVNFAVYSDGVEARLEVTLSDLELSGFLEVGKPVEVYGMVKTSNSVLTHSEAKSVLFDHMTRQECVSLASWPPGEAEIPLPLTRSVTVIPRESTLMVDVSVFLSCPPQDICIAKGSTLFRAESRSGGTVEEHIILGNHAKVKVKVTWVEGAECVAAIRSETQNDDDDDDGEEEEDDDDDYDDDYDDDDGEREEEGELYENISDDGGSSRSVKLRRLNSQEDITLGYVLALLFTNFSLISRQFAQMNQSQANEACECAACTVNYEL